MCVLFKKPVKEYLREICHGNSPCPAATPLMMREPDPFLPHVSKAVATAMMARNVIIAFITLANGDMVKWNGSFISLNIFWR